MAASAAPPRTVKSSPCTTARRPSIRPEPITTLAGRKSSTWPSSPYVARPARAPVSWKLPGSKRRSIRSRTVSRPEACWRATRSWPPMRRASSSRLRSSSSSRSQVMAGGYPAAQPVCLGALERAQPGAARVRQRRQPRLDLLAARLEEGGQDDRLAEVLERLVGGEARAERRDLEQHAAGLAEVDGAKPETIDDRGGPGAALDDAIAPGLVLVHLRRPRHMVDCAASGHARLGRRLVVAVQPAAPLPPGLPAAAGGGEAERLLEQRAAALGIARVRPDAVEPVEGELGGDLRVVGDQRGVRDRADRQLVGEALRIGEAQAMAVPLALEALRGQPLGPEVERL